MATAIQEQIMTEPQLSESDIQSLKDMMKENGMYEQNPEACDKFSVYWKIMCGRIIVQTVWGRIHLFHLRNKSIVPQSALTNYENGLGQSTIRNPEICKLADPIDLEVSLWEVMADDSFISKYVNFFLEEASSANYVHLFSFCCKQMVELAKRWNITLLPEFGNTDFPKEITALSLGGFVAKYDKDRLIIEESGKTGNIVIIPTDKETDLNDPSYCMFPVPTEEKKEQEEETCTIQEGSPKKQKIEKFHNEEPQFIMDVAELEIIADILMNLSSTIKSQEAPPSEDEAEVSDDEFVLDKYEILEANKRRLEYSKAPSGTACDLHRRWKKRCGDDCKMRKKNKQKKAINKLKTETASIQLDATWDTWSKSTTTKSRRTPKNPHIFTRSHLSVPVSL